MYLIAALIPIAGLLLHYLYLRSSVVDAYNGQPTPFINFILNTLYPRFYVEKERFDLAFFLYKSDQLIYRFSIVYYFLLGLLFLYKEKINVREKINVFLHTKTTSKNITVLRFLFFSYFLYLSYELIDELIDKQSLRLFYKPISFLSIAHIPFPDTITILIIGGILFILSLLIMTNKRVVLCTVASLLLFILLQSWTFSFEKLDHGYVTFTYAFMLLPFLFDEQRKNKDEFNSWSLQLIKISVAIVYFLSGLEKIITSQLSWLKPDNLKTYLSFHETALSKLVIQSDLLCIILNIGSLGIQLSFILILFLPKYKWLWIAGGIVFHTGTLILMKIGIILNPWIFVYVFFFDWTTVYVFFSEKFRKERLRSI